MRSNERRLRSLRERRDIGMCSNCPSDAQPGRTRCRKCGQRNSELARKRQRMKKAGFVPATPGNREERKT